MKNPGTVEPAAGTGSSSVVGKSKGGRPSREAQAALNRRILESAAELFAVQGFAATTMEQVASVCGAGKDTIYRRYSSKSALFKALMEGLQAEVLSELDAQMDAGPRDARDRLKRFARALLSINLRPQMIALNRVALGEAVTLGGVKPTSTIEDPIMKRFALLVKQAQAEGALKRGATLFIAEQLLYATSIRPLISEMLGEGRFSDPAEQERYFSQAWKLFLEGALGAGGQA
ncbi:MAG TPA: TetR/AcrR family transcriptional regulator [Mesorhizobium sp.]|jgi:AcrR family transcriptional regulator|uniref:TetR/AcrR family transcriptional regulator n=1 Tax=Mesorhizobium sp. TaxID=1871066 RepID=UPI002DDD1ECE|nr:TetR/AcrR family transcriptional regulator [Mesorhizobium sp.]HEV2502611.1 TetR/AcrR family transcriptional regulator [Mesorhizobium sp.]